MTYLGRKAGERNRAEELAAHCLRLAAASGDEIVRAWSLWNADRLEEALPIFEAAGHQGGIRVTRGSFAGRALNVCDYAAALQWCGSDMEPFARARIARETGDYETAWDIYRQQREKSRTAGHLINYSLTFAYTGLLALAEGRLEEARQLVQQADNEFSERGQTGYRLLPLLYLTEISWREGDLTGALAQINVMREMFPSRPSSIDALHGRLLLAAGDRDQSYTYLRRCLEIFKKRPLDTAVALEHLAFWWGEGQDVVPAVRLLGVADALRERFGTPRGPVDLADHEALLCRLRETLDESAFTTAWESGRAMSWEQAVAYALGQEVVAE
jgi:tetratricopeptide (TPR) repeat protein